ncbi:MAG: hypothetical protein ACLSVD_14870 [Eggerthellaceae bacterium]
MEEEKDEDGESREKDELGSKRRGQDLQSHPDTERLQGGLHRGVLRHGSEGTVISQSVQEGKVVIVVSKGPKP